MLLTVLAAALVRGLMDLTCHEHIVAGRRHKFPQIVRRLFLSSVVIKVEAASPPSGCDNTNQDRMSSWPTSSTMASLASGTASLISASGLDTASFDSASSFSRGISGLDLLSGSLGRSRRLTNRQSYVSKSQDSDKPFQCPKCGQTYKQSGSLGRHRRQCEGMYTLTCIFCLQKFHRKDRYREHLLSKHQYVDEELGPPGYTLPQE